METLTEDDNINTALAGCIDKLKQAEKLYTSIEAASYRLDPKSDSRHIEPIREGINLFKKKAEISS